MLLLDIVQGLVQGMEEIGKNTDAKKQLIRFFLNSVPSAYIHTSYQHPKVQEVILLLSAAVKRRRAMGSCSTKSRTLKAAVVALSKRTNTKDFSSLIKKTNGYLPILLAFILAGFGEDDFKSEGVEEEEGEEGPGPGDNNWWSSLRTSDLKFLAGGKEKSFRRKLYTTFHNSCTVANVQGSDDVQFTEEEHGERYGVWWTILGPLLIPNIRRSVGTAVLERVGQQGDGGGASG
ncbi:hypothetical protein TrRE_jg10273, partial [Triparma retinervis]